MIHVIYHPEYNQRGPGGRGGKAAAHVWQALMRRYGDSLYDMHLAPDAPLTSVQLRMVHSDDYLQRLGNARYLSKVLASPWISTLPARVTNLNVLRPMRWATAGTVLGAQAGLNNGLIFNLGGGYNSAGPNGGAAGSVYADVALAIQGLRENKRLEKTDTVAYIDLGALPAHGVSAALAKDLRTGIFDIYNQDSWQDEGHSARVLDRFVSVNSVTASSRYMHLLREALPEFLDQLAAVGPTALAVVNLGADAYINDRKGGLSLTADAVLLRDQAVIAELRRREIPILIVPGQVRGKKAQRIIVNTIDHCLKRYGT